MSPVESLREDALRELFDGLARTAPAPVTTDLEAARLAWTPPRNPLRRRVSTVVGRYRWVAVPALVAAALVLVVSLLAALPSLRLAPVPPAATPSGPGALPSTVWEPPVGTPSVVDAPISRAAYLLAPQRSDQGWQAAIVGADDGRYRVLPFGPGDRQAVLSRDGRTVAWLRALDENRTAVEVLDVPTGRLREVRLSGAYGLGVRVGAVAVSPDGKRLLLMAGDILDPFRSLSKGMLVTLGEGDGSTVRTFAYPAGGIGWTSDGRPIIPALSGAEATAFGEPFVALPSLPSGIEGAPALSADGRTLVAVTQESSTAGSGTPGPMTLRGVGAASGTAALGSPLTATALAAVGDGALVYRIDRATAGGDPASSRFTDGSGVGRRVVRVSWSAGQLLSPEGRVTSVEGPLDITAVAADVVAGGRVGPGVRPQAGPTDLTWWAAWSGRVLPVAGGVLAVVLSFAAISVGERRHWVRRGSRALWRRRRQVGAAVGVVVGLGLLLAPSAVEQAWVLTGPVPQPGARPVVPSALVDQPFVPPRAFDREGVPRTYALSLVWQGAVAGRTGWYGTDALTGRIVRLDDVPGTIEHTRSYVNRPSEVRLRLSDNGSTVLATLGEQEAFVIRLDTAQASMAGSLAAPYRGAAGYFAKGLPASDGSLLAIRDDGTIVADPDGALDRRGEAAASGVDVRLPGLQRRDVRGFRVEQPQTIEPPALPWWGTLGRPWLSGVGLLVLAGGVGLGFGPRLLRLRPRAAP